MRIDEAIDPFEDGDLGQDAEGDEDDFADGLMDDPDLIANMEDHLDDGEHDDAQDLWGEDEGSAA